VSKCNCARPCSDSHPDREIRACGTESKSAKQSRFHLYSSRRADKISDTCHSISSLAFQSNWIKTQRPFFCPFSPHITLHKAEVGSSSSSKAFFAVRHKRCDSVLLRWDVINRTKFSRFFFFRRSSVLFVGCKSSHISSSEIFVSSGSDGAVRSLLSSLPKNFSIENHNRK